MTDTPSSPAHPDRTGRRVSPQDLLGGLALAALGVFALWLTRDLPVGRAMRMGPGYLPQLLGWAVVGLGLLVAAGGLVGAGPGIERWRLRGPVFILGAIVLFGLSVRGFTIPAPTSSAAAGAAAAPLVTVPPLGIALSAFLAVFVCSFASRESRVVEALLYGIVLAVFCSLLFRVGLGLPLEIWPRGLFY